MTITIPTWFFWVLGIPLGIVALGLMGLGAVLLRMLWSWRGW